MRALLSTASGGPETLVMGELPEPTAGPGQVLLKIVAALHTFHGNQNARKVQLLHDLGRGVEGSFETITHLTCGGEILSRALAHELQYHQSVFNFAIDLDHEGDL